MSSSPRPDSARVRRKSKTKEQDGYAPTNNNTHKANGTHQTYKQSQQQNSQQQQNGYNNNKYSPNQERQRTHPPSERQKYIPVDQRTKRQPQQSQQQQPQQQSQPPPPQQQQPQQEQPQQQEREEQQQATEPTEFNPSEVEQHLQQVWNTVFDQARDTKTTENERPIVYQDSSRAWGNDTKISFLSNFNFSTELKKAYIARYGAFPRFVPKYEATSDGIGKSGTNNTTNTNNINNSTTPNGNIHSNNTLQNNIQSVNNGIHSTGDSVNSNEKTDRTKDNINSTTPNGKHNDNTKASEITSSDEISADSDDVALENGNAEEAPAENGVAEEAAGDDVAEEGQSHYNHDEYEEISDPTDDKATGNPGDVIIDINDTGDDDVITTTSPSKAEGKKPKKKPKKNKSKQKNVNSAPNQGEQTTTTTTTNNHVTAENNNNNTNATNTITISNHNNGNIILPSNNKEWEFLGTILPRPKSEFKTTGTGTLQVDNSGNFQFSQETLQTTNPDVTFAPQMLTGIPREAARVFADRFGKPNQANNSSYTTAVPVKWSSGESLAALRKFPMEVPLFLKDMLSVKTTSKSSCSNLKCQNTTSEDKPFKTCAKCNVAAYCSRECQKEDWVKRHKMNCKPNATASEEQRKTYATQKLWTTSSIRQMIFLHWHARYGKGVVVMMCRDFLASHLDEDPNGRELYIFYMPMADLLSEDCPLPALKKCQAEFTKSFVSHDSESQSIASAAMDSSGFILPHVDEVKTLQLKLYKRSCAREHDLSRVDAISVDPQNHATLYTFH